MISSRLGDGEEPWKIPSARFPPLSRQTPKTIKNVEFFNSSAEKAFLQPKSKPNRQKIGRKNPLTIEKTACRPFQTSKKRQISREKPGGKIAPSEKTP
jgi:hypothetical protein